MVLAVLSAGEYADADSTAMKFPQPQGSVNDFAGIIAPEYRLSIKSISDNILAKTGASVVVVTVTTMEGADPAEYANRLYEKWGIGKEGKDKGVLIFLALKERKIRIETGYGAEGIIPDGLAGEILDRYVMPFLKKEDYSRGLYNAVAAIASVIASDAGITLENVSQPRQLQRDAVKRSTPNPLSYIILFIMAILLIGTRRGRRMLPYLLLAILMGGGGGRRAGGFGGFSGGFGGFGGGMSGGGGAGRGF